LHVPAFPNAVANLSLTFASQAMRPELSFFAATLDWQFIRPASFLPIVFNLVPVHLSALAGTAPRPSTPTRAARTRRPTGRADGMGTPLTDRPPRLAGVQWSRLRTAGKVRRQQEN